MDAPSDEDVLTLVQFARGEGLVERRRRNLVVSREPSFSLSWIGENNWTLATRGLLSRVMGFATRSRRAFLPVDTSLERETALLVSALLVFPMWMVSRPWVSSSRR